MCENCRCLLSYELCITAFKSIEVQAEAHSWVYGLNDNIGTDKEDDCSGLWCEECVIKNYENVSLDNEYYDNRVERCHKAGIYL